MNAIGMGPVDTSKVKAYIFLAIMLSLEDTYLSLIAENKVLSDAVDAQSP